MEEIRLWKLIPTDAEKPRVDPVETLAETATEKFLEDILTTSPDLLMPNLTLIGRQCETPGEPLDLLGIDEDGQLVVFELKRGTLTRDAVAQVIDYASFLAELEAEELSSYINERSGAGGTATIKDFVVWYQNEFQRPVADIGTPRIVIVGLGVDDRAKRMVAFLAKCELDIALITFHGFKENGSTLLARQVEVQPRSAVASARITKSGNQGKLDSLLVKLHIKTQYDELAQTLRQGLGPAAYPWPNPTGYSFYLPETAESGGPSNRAYIGLFCPEDRKGAIQVLLQPRAAEAAGKGSLEQFAKRMDAPLAFKPNGLGELWFDGHKPSQTFAAHLRDLGEAIASGWKKKRDHSSGG